MTNSVNLEDLTDSQKILVISLGLNDAQNKLNRHEELLVTGNGKLPLVERVRNVEAFVDSVKYWMRFLIGAIVIQTIAFAVAAVTYFIRLYPLLVKLSESP